MRIVPIHVRTGAHAPRTPQVVVVGRHRGMMEQALDALLHEGFRSQAVIAAHDFHVAVAEALDAAEHPLDHVEVLVLCGAVPAQERPGVVAVVRERFPDVHVIEHLGSFQRLFDEVVDALGVGPA